MTNKQRVMELLFDANSKIDPKVAMWVASHLPDEDGTKGTHEITDDLKYDHDQDDVMEAIGIDEEDLVIIRGEITKFAKGDGKNRNNVSQVIEYLLKNLTPKKLRIVGYAACEYLRGNERGSSSSFSSKSKGSIMLGIDGEGDIVLGGENIPDFLKKKLQAKIKELKGEGKSSHDMIKSLERFLKDLGGKEDGD